MRRGRFYGPGWLPIGSKAPFMVPEMEKFAILVDSNYPELLDYVFANPGVPKLSFWADGAVYWLTGVDREMVKQEFGDSHGTYQVESWGSGPVTTRQATLRFEREQLTPVVEVPS